MPRTALDGVVLKAIPWCTVGVLCFDVGMGCVVPVARQINARTELALRYNDQSVLENHHAFVCSTLIKKHDLFAGLSKEQSKEVRRAP